MFSALLGSLLGPIFGLVSTVESVASLGSLGSLGSLLGSLGSLGSVTSVVDGLTSDISLDANIDLTLGGVQVVDAVIELA